MAQLRRVASLGRASCFCSAPLKNTFKISASKILDVDCSGASVSCRTMMTGAMTQQRTGLVVPEETQLPEEAQVVIAGAGMIGNAVAYHLVEHGYTDVVIIDKGQIADGTSKYGSGMLGLFRPAEERNIVEYCIELYTKLESEGYDLGFERCGSLNLASNEDRLISLKRRASRYRPTGVKCELMGPSQLGEMHPHLNTKDLLGGVWMPDDACVDAGKVSEVLAYLAYKKGAKFISNCGVKRVSTQKPKALSLHHQSSKNVRVTGVKTDLGNIKCEYFVNCAGIWAREIGRLSNPKVRVPVCSAEHFFLTYEPIPELANKKLPNIRDYDAQIYMRVFGSSYMMGAFEKLARPWEVSKHGHDKEWAGVKEEHWIHMQPYIAAACHRLPILKETQYDVLSNTPDAFTPDGRWILGETPEVANYFVCAGMNGNSLQGAGGVGKAVADWIVNKKPPGNMLQFEVQRFTSLHNNSQFLLERAKETVGRHYALEYPLVSEFKLGRKIRSSPIYSELEARGAVFGERMGWERVLYFDPYHHREDPPAELPDGTFGKPEFFDQIEDEYLVCREGVGLIDMSSFAKFIVKGDEGSVISYLQKLCSNDINIPVGGIVPTGMQNEAGGYENDCMLIRRAHNSFFMVSPTQQQTRILEWMENQLPSDNSVGLQDVTSMFTVLSLAGPKSKDLMEEMSGTDMAMHPFTYKEVNVGYASGVMVLAVTNTGEPGYSLYIPSEFALQIYDNLMKVGRDYGIKNVGHLAMRFLRIEKFIPFWGEELTALTTPNEVNRTFKVKFDKDEDFLGKAALLKEKENGVYKRLVQFHLEDFDKDEDVWPWGGESVYRNGKYVGYLTSTAYGFTLHKMVALGFVRHPDDSIVPLDWVMDRAAEWTIDIVGKQVRVSVHLHPPKMPIITQEGPGADYKPKKHYQTVQLIKSKEKKEAQK